MSHRDGMSRPSHASLASGRVIAVRRCAFAAAAAAAQRARAYARCAAADRAGMAKAAAGRRRAAPGRGRWQGGLVPATLQAPSAWALKPTEK
eukprot:209321-Chlamydomonas_euryale.AAC.6